MHSSTCLWASRVRTWLTARVRCFCTATQCLYCTPPPLLGKTQRRMHTWQDGARQGFRSDGRGVLDFRPVQVETGVVPSASGSMPVTHSPQARYPRLCASQARTSRPGLRGEGGCVPPACCIVPACSATCASRSPPRLTTVFSLCPSIGERTSTLVHVHAWLQLAVVRREQGRSRRSDESLRHHAAVRTRHTGAARGCPGWWPRPRCWIASGCVYCRGTSAGTCMSTSW